MGGHLHAQMSSWKRGPCDHARLVAQLHQVGEKTLSSGPGCVRFIFPWCFSFKLFSTLSHTYTYVVNLHSREPPWRRPRQASGPVRGRARRWRASKTGGTCSWRAAPVEAARQDRVPRPSVPVAMGPRSATAARAARAPAARKLWSNRSPIHRPSAILNRRTTKLVISPFPQIRRHLQSRVLPQTRWPRRR